MHLACVAVFLELFNGLIGVLLFLREQDDLGGVVLQEMSGDAETDSCRAACYDVDLGRGWRVSAIAWALADCEGNLVGFDVLFC